VKDFVHITTRSNQLKGTHKSFYLDQQISRSGWPVERKIVSTTHTGLSDNDASSTAIGGVLSQIDENRERVAAYFRSANHKEIILSSKESYSRLPTIPDPIIRLSDLYANFLKISDLTDFFGDSIVLVNQIEVNVGCPCTVSRVPKVGSIMSLCVT
jgi:hypothetical protein